MKPTKNQHGQALFEFTLLVPFFLFVLTALVLLSQTLLLKMRAQALARLGVQLQSSGLVSDAVAQLEVTRWAHHLRTPHTSLVSLDMGRFTGTAAAKFYDLRFTTVRFLTRHPLFEKWGWTEGIPVQGRLVSQRENQAGDG